jgi:hypothetical protein
MLFLRYSHLYYSNSTFLYAPLPSSPSPLLSRRLLPVPLPPPVLKLHKVAVSRAADLLRLHGEQLPLRALKVSGGEGNLEAVGEFTRTLTEQKEQLVEVGGEDGMGRVKFVVLILCLVGVLFGGSLLVGCLVIAYWWEGCLVVAHWLVV